MPRPAALAYHAITDAWPDSLAISRSSFRAQIHGLAQRGLRGVTLAEVARGARRGDIAITFDDGFASVATSAKGILDEVGWRATVFLVSDAVGRDAPMLWLGGRTPTYEAERHALDWDAVAVLAEAGWEVGSHGRTHRLLSALPDDELDEELSGSRAAIESHGYACASISYPFGEVEDRVIRAARVAGYTAGSGLAGRFHPGDPMRIPRVAVDGHDGDLRFAIKTSRWFAAGRSTVLWTLLEQVRRRGHPLGI